MSKKMKLKFMVKRDDGSIVAIPAKDMGRCVAEMIEDYQLDYMDVCNMTKKDYKRLGSLAYGLIQEVAELVSLKSELVSLKAAVAKAEKEQQLTVQGV